MVRRAQSRAQVLIINTINIVALLFCCSVLINDCYAKYDPDFIGRAIQMQ